MMAIAAAGEEHKTLRKIAAALLAKQQAGMCRQSTSLLIGRAGAVGDASEDAVRLHHTIVRKIVEPSAK
jgi:hypothetical protein